MKLAGFTARELRIAEYTETQLVEAGFSNAAIRLAGYGQVSWSFGGYTFASTITEGDAFLPDACEPSVVNSGQSSHVDRPTSGSGDSGGSGSDRRRGVMRESFDLPGLPAPATGAAVTQPSPPPRAAATRAVLGNGRFNDRQLSQQSLSSAMAPVPISADEAYEGPSFDEWDVLLRSKERKVSASCDSSNGGGRPAAKDHLEVAPRLGAPVGGYDA